MVYARMISQTKAQKALMQIHNARMEVFMKAPQLFFLRMAFVACECTCQSNRFYNRIPGVEATFYGF